MTQRILLSWSSGKDSAWCLHVLKQCADVEIVGLLTTFNESTDRVAMHAVRRELVARQAKAAEVPLFPVMLPWPCSNDDYERRIGEALSTLTTELELTGVAFGDLFLADIRRYREECMQPTGLDCLFPLWGFDTRALALTMIDAGARAILTCVDPRRCPASTAGRQFDGALLEDLPADVDPCGENGEFHTFVYDHPAFAERIDVHAAPGIERDGFVFADLVPR
ncbi:MAG: ATP-binding protein [Pseudomonadota bacterium]